MADSASLRPARSVSGCTTVLARLWQGPRRRCVRHHRPVLCCERRWMPRFGRSPVIAAAGIQSSCWWLYACPARAGCASGPCRLRGPGGAVGRRSLSSARGEVPAARPGRSPGCRSRLCPVSLRCGWAGFCSSHARQRLPAAAWIACAVTPARSPPAPGPSPAGRGREGRRAGPRDHAGVISKDRTWLPGKTYDACVGVSFHFWKAPPLAAPV